jgi:hypothetical protein
MPERRFPPPLRYQCLLLALVGFFAFVSSTDASVCKGRDFGCFYGPHGGTNRDPTYNAACPQGRRMCPPGQCALSGRRDACDMRNCAAKNCPNNAPSSFPAGVVH